MNRNKLFLLILILALSCKAYAEEHGNRKGTCVYKETLQLRSNLTSSINRFSRDGKIFYKYTEHGKGDYDKYQDVTWEIDAEMEEKEDFLYLLYANRIIRDGEGNVVVKYEKQFDYEKRKIHYISSYGKGNIIKKKNFPIKGKTTDNITLSYFLETFVAHRSDKSYGSFYLISSEPRLYRIHIKVIGSEDLELPMGKIKAVKLRLIPDLGLLTGLSGAFIPPTYVWHTEQPPFIWLKYEGLETGLGSSHVVVYIS